MPALTASQARASLPYISSAVVMTAPGDLHTLRVTYLHHLVARGDLADLQTFVGGLEEEDARILVNATLMETYWGNTLHTAAYWNTGETLMSIAAYLVSKGAVFELDYYESYPWSTTGTIYVSPFTNASIGDRNPAEFEASLGALRLAYGPQQQQQPQEQHGAGAGAPAATAPAAQNQA
jgi:hypothetical protein